MKRAYMELMNEINQTKEWLEGFKVDGITEHDSEAFWVRHKDLFDRSCDEYIYTDPDAFCDMERHEMLSALDQLVEIYDNLPIAEEEQG